MYGSVAKFSDPNRLFFSGWKATIFFFKVVAADEVGSRIFFSFVRSFDDDDRHTTPKKKFVAIERHTQKKILRCYFREQKHVYF